LPRARPDRQRSCAQLRPDRCGSAGDGRARRGRMSTPPALGRRLERAACSASHAVSRSAGISRCSRPQGIVGRSGERGWPSLLTTICSRSDRLLM
jgi:hypothetical protein